MGVRDAPHIWGAGEIRDAGERRLFGGLARSEPFVTPHVWGTGEMSTEISAPYLGRWGNTHWKSRRIYVALGHDELRIQIPRGCVIYFVTSLINDTNKPTKCSHDDYCSPNTIISAVNLVYLNRGFIICCSLVEVISTQPTSFRVTSLGMWQTWIREKHR